MPTLRERGEYDLRVDRLPYYDRPQIPDEEERTEAAELAAAS